MWTKVVSVFGIMSIGFFAGVCFQSAMLRAARDGSSSNSVSDVKNSQFVQEAPTIKQASPESSGVPMIAVEEPTYHFGDVFQTGTEASTVRHDFTIYNRGSAPLSITSVKPDCSCTTARISRKSIPPGESASLAVALDLTGQQGSVTQVIALESNDTGAGVVKVSLKGATRPLFENLPVRIDLGRLMPGQSTSRNIFISPIDGLPVEVLEANPTKEALAVDLEELEESRKYKLSISLDAPHSEGDYRAAIRLTTNHPSAKEVLVPVRAYIGTGGPLLMGDIPEIAGPGLDGGMVNVADFRGGPTVVVFWASWCGFCKNELPKLVQLKEKYGSQGLNIVGVNIDREAKAAVEACQKLGITWKNIHFADESQGVGNKNPISARYKVSAVPSMYVLDRDGKIVIDKVHKVNYHQALINLLEPLPTPVGQIDR